MTAPVRKHDQVAALVRSRIADGTLKPGMLAPSGLDLARETGFAVLTCRAALTLLLAEGTLMRVSRTSRPRVAGEGQGGGAAGLAVKLAQAMAAWRHAADMTQVELAGMIGLSVTTVGHAETGRLWQSRTFWERVDVALDARGGLLARYDAWQETLALEDAAELLARCDASQADPAASAAAGEPFMPAVAAVHAEPDVPNGVVITLPCDPVPVTVRWGDGSVTTV